jgi:hypothetical protein
MSRAFYFSLAGNFILIAVSLALWVRGNVPPSSIQAVSSESPAFHWRQIDSDDFPTFVGNLRSIGCPESIIHDIVKGELTEIYAEKEKAAVAPALPIEARPTPTSAVRAAGSQPRQTVSEVRAERDQTLAALLAPAGPAKRADSPAIPDGQPAAGDLPNSVNPQNTVQPQVVQQTQTPMPVYPVFASHVLGSTNSSSTSPKTGIETNETGASPTAAPVSVAEQMALEKIQNDFVQAVGGADQDPTDPAYLEKWKAAQQVSDDQYKKFFGGRAYVRRQMEDVRRAALERAAAGQ